jgi:hypothetical protein
MNSGVEDVLGSLVPIALVAVTANVYDVPVVRPAITAEVLEPLTVAVKLPGVDVTV